MLKLLEFYFYHLYSFWRNYVNKQWDKDYILLTPLIFAYAQILLPIAWLVILVFINTAVYKNDSSTFDSYAGIGSIVLGIIFLIVLYLLFERKKRYLDIEKKFDFYYSIYKEKENIHKTFVFIFLFISYASVIIVGWVVIKG